MKLTLLTTSLLASLAAADYCTFCTDNNGKAVNLATKKACDNAFGGNGPTTVANPEGTYPDVTCGPMTQKAQATFDGACNAIGYGAGSETCPFFNTSPGPGKRAERAGPISRIKRDDGGATIPACCTHEDNTIDEKATEDICLQVFGKIKGLGNKCEIKESQKDQYLSACITEYNDKAEAGPNACNLNG